MSRQVTGAIARRDVQAAAERDRQMRVVAANAAALGVGFERGSGGAGMLVAERRYGCGRSRRSPAPAASRAAYARTGARPRRTADRSRSSGCRGETAGFPPADAGPRAAGRSDRRRPACRRRGQNRSVPKLNRRRARRGGCTSFRSCRDSLHRNRRACDQMIRTLEIGDARGMHVQRHDHRRGLWKVEADLTTEADAHGITVWVRFIRLPIIRLPRPATRRALRDCDGIVWSRPVCRTGRRR